MASLPPNLDIDGVEYVWQLARLYPPQGAWTEEKYLSLTDHENLHVEFVEGRLEFLPMPTEAHHEILQLIFLQLHAFVAKLGCGKVHFNGLRVRTQPAKYREPDIVFLAKENFGKRKNRFWVGADLAVEIVSDDPKDRKRDYEDKLVEYAQAGIAEYWIVDYQERVVIVNKLADGANKYSEHGRFSDGDQATSVLLEGFSIDVASLFEAADELVD